MAIEKEDFSEARCPLCMEDPENPPKVKPVPIKRIFEKADSYYATADYDGAERVLLYWLEEAKNGNDVRGEMLISSELMGTYRKTKQADKAIFYAEHALDLSKDPSIHGTTAEATAYINAATVYQAFGESTKSIPLFEKASAIYQDTDASDDLRGALYNNMGTTLTSLERYDEARNSFNKAIEYMSRVETGALDIAITYLNLSNLEEAEKGIIDAAEIIDGYLDKAEIIFEDKSIPCDGYYAFVCDKCAPTFEYYGRFGYAEELVRRKNDIYERS